LEGRSGPKGLGGVRPQSDYAQPTGPGKRGEHSAGADAMFDVGYFPPNTPPTSVLPDQAV
jgi:hypothetical protein